MKLNKEDIVNLVQAIDVCTVGGIEDVVIEEGNIFGVNQSKTFAIISNFKIPNLGQKAGITKIASLKSILDVFKDKDLFLETEETDRGEIRLFTIKSGKSKADFRCTNTSLLKPPRKINDEGFCEISVIKSEMAEMLSMLKVIGPTTVTLSVMKNGNVSLAGNGNGGNTFRCDVESKADFRSDEQTVTHHYETGIFSSLIRAMNNSYDSYGLFLGENGTLSCVLNGHRVTMLATIDGDE